MKTQWPESLSNAFIFIAIKYDYKTLNLFRFFISGDKKGTKELFADLPGFSDNIRLTDQNTLLVPFAVVRNNIFGSFLDLFGRYPFIRTLISYVSQ